MMVVAAAAGVVGVCIFLHIILLDYLSSRNVASQSVDEFIL